VIKVEPKGRRFFLHPLAEVMKTMSGTAQPTSGDIPEDKLRPPNSKARLHRLPKVLSVSS